MTTSPPTQDALIEAADALVNGFAWSSMEADCIEARDNLNEKIVAVREAIGLARSEALATPINGEAREAVDHGLDLVALDKIARNATPGPWERYEAALGIVHGTIQTEVFGAVSVQVADVYASSNREGDWTYVATFDPPTVLKLLAALTKADACLRALASRGGGGKAP